MFLNTISRVIHWTFIFMRLTSLSVRRQRPDSQIQPCQNLHFDLEHGVGIICCSQFLNYWKRKKHSSPGIHRITTKRLSQQICIFTQHFGAQRDVFPVGDVTEVLRWRRVFSREEGGRVRRTGQEKRVKWKERLGKREMLAKRVPWFEKLRSEKLCQTHTHTSRSPSADGLLFSSWHFTPPSFSDQCSIWTNATMQIIQIINS